ALLIREGEMRRREFIAGVGAAAACPVSSWAQSSRKVPTIGFLSTSTAASWSKWTPAFVQRLAALGWVEGRTVLIEYRWAEGREERYAELVADLVGLQVDVIVTSGGAVLA